MGQTGCLNGDVVNALAINDGRSLIAIGGQMDISVIGTQTAGQRRPITTNMALHLDMEGASGRYVISADLGMQLGIEADTTKWHVTGADFAACLLGVWSAPIKRQQGISNISMALNTHDKMQFSFLHRARRGRVLTVEADIRASTLREDA